MLRAVRELTEDGWPASVDEVASRVGYASKSTAYYRLLELIETGHVQRHPRNSKGGFRATVPA